jgi:hypothetical protein
MGFSEYKIYLAVIFTSLVRFTQIGGLVNVVGTLVPYLHSYFHSIDPEIHSSTVLLTTTVGYIFEGSSGPLMSYLTFYYSEFSLMLFAYFFGMALYALCTFITNAYLYFFLFGLNIGVLSNFLRILPVWIAWKRLGESHKGLVVGISSAANGISPLIYGNLFCLISNPDNEPPGGFDEEHYLFSGHVNGNVPIAGRWMTAALAVTGAIGALILYSRGGEIKKKKDQSNVDIFGLLKHPNFWYLFWYFFFKCFYYYFLLNSYKLIGLHYLKDEHSIALMTIAVFVCIAVSRVAGGELFDMFEWSRVNTVFLTIEIFCCLTMPLVLENLYLYGIWLSCSVSVAAISYISVWMLSEKLFSNASWVITFVALAPILDMLVMNVFHAYIIDVLEK